MSEFNIKVSMEQAWSIDDRGFFQVEVTPKGRPDRVIERVVLNDDLIIECLETDMEDVTEVFDPTDWVNLKNSLRDIADQIEEVLESIND